MAWAPVLKLILQLGLLWMKGKPSRDKEKKKDEIRELVAKGDLINVSDKLSDLFDNVKRLRKKKGSDNSKR